MPISASDFVEISFEGKEVFFIGANNKQRVPPH